MWFEPGHVETVVEVVPPEAALLLAALSFLGSIYVVAPLVLGELWYRNHERGLAWAAILLGAYGLVVALKAAVPVHRPTVDPPVAPAVLPEPLGFVYLLTIEPSGLAFPSGHALIAVVFWSLLAAAYLADRPRLGLATVVAVVTVVGVSRVALAAHYPIDVVAGIALGIGYLGAVRGVQRHVDRDRAALIAIAVAVGAVAVIVSDGVKGPAVLGGALGLALVRASASGHRTVLPATPGGVAASGIGLAILAGVAAVVLLEPGRIAVGVVGLMAALIVGWTPLGVRRVRTREVRLLPVSLRRQVGTDDAEVPGD